jgi:heme a synthase
MSADIAQAPAAASLRSPRASVASWLGVLFMLLLLVIVAGGYVRLSGSGLSIPKWPVINGSLLPPMTDLGWEQVKTQFEDDQQRLRLEKMRGGLGMGSLGHIPQDMPTFKRMFMIEWGHRFVAALVGLVAAGCLVVTLRHREVRERIGALLITACALILGQALLGGLLVSSGTATQWLFLHLGTAALILTAIVWCILRLLCEVPRLDPAMARERRGLVMVAGLSAAVAWLQIVLGGLVAGSRGDMSSSEDFVTTWPEMHGELVPSLWYEHRSVAWNLIDNALLHQWVHRWFALGVVLAVGAVYLISRRARLGPRLRLSLKLSYTFIGAQVVLGLANVLERHPIVVSLSHLVMGMFLLASLVLVLFDARHEPPARLAGAAGGPST